jgi:hypothetical protein
MALRPLLPWGFFSNHLGGKTVFGIYLWHFVWGVNLGLIYNPLPANEINESTASSAAVGTSQPAHARV